MAGKEVEGLVPQAIPVDHTIYLTKDGMRFEFVLPGYDLNNLEVVFEQEDKSMMAIYSTGPSTCKSLSLKEEDCIYKGTKETPFGFGFHVNPEMVNVNNPLITMKSGILYVFLPFKG